MTTSRKYRVRLKLPATLMRDCGNLADAPETEMVLTDFVHSVVVTATKAAERGEHRLLPARLPRDGPAPEGGMVQVQFVASRTSAARAAAALESVGSSVRACVIAGLEALRDAGGVWEDTVTPGERGFRPAVRAPGPTAPE